MLAFVGKDTPFSFVDGEKLGSYLQEVDAEDGGANGGDGNIDEGPPVAGDGNATTTNNDDGGAPMDTSEGGEATPMES